MKIAKPLLLVSTPIGVAWGLLEAYRLAGGLVILMATMIGTLGAAAPAPHPLVATQIGDQHPWKSSR
jgi:hypothetical protein